MSIESKSNESKSNAVTSKENKSNKEPSLHSVALRLYRCFVTQLCPSPASPRPHLLSVQQQQQRDECRSRCCCWQTDAVVPQPTGESVVQLLPLLVLPTAGAAIVSGFEPQSTVLTVLAALLVAVTVALLVPLSANHAELAQSLSVAPWLQSFAVLRLSPLLAL